MKILLTLVRKPQLYRAPDRNILSYDGFPLLP